MSAPRKLCSKLEIWKQVMLILYLSLIRRLNASDFLVAKTKSLKCCGKNCSRCCPSLLSDVWILSSLQPWNLAGLRVWVPATDCSPTSHEKQERILKEKDSKTTKKDNKKRIEQERFTDIRFLRFRHIEFTFDNKYSYNTTLGCLFNGSESDGIWRKVGSHLNSLHFSPFAKIGCFVPLFGSRVSNMI